MNKTDARPLSYVAAKVIKDAANAECEIAAARLSAAKGDVAPGSLTPDHIKFSPAYQEAHREFTKAFRHMREVNQWFCKTYKREYHQDIMAQREAKAKGIK